MGCREPLPYPAYDLPGIGSLARCPHAIIYGPPRGEDSWINYLDRGSPAARTYMHLFYFFEKGIMPNSGGLLNQPAPYVDAMLVIGSEHARILAAKQREAAKPAPKLPITTA